MIQIIFIVAVNLLTTVVNIVFTIFQEIKNMKKKKLNKIETSKGSPEQTSSRKRLPLSDIGEKKGKEKEMKKFKLNFSFKRKSLFKNLASSIKGGSLATKTDLSVPKK